MQVSKWMNDFQDIINVTGWKAHCIGSNANNASGILKQDYKDDMTMDEAISLALKVIAKTMDATSISADKCMPL